MSGVEHTDSQHGITVTAEALHAVAEQLSDATTRHLPQIFSPATGGRRSKSVGRGMEYEQSRNYVAGDDIRAMDWRLMARTGEPYTRQYAQERARQTILAIDLSASMFFGSRHSLKSWTACQVAAHVGWRVLQAGDQPGWMVANGEHCRFSAPAPRREGLNELFSWLVEDGNRPLPAGAEDSQLNAMLHELVFRQRTAANIILITDFIGLDEQSVSHLQALAARHHLAGIWVHDISEILPWQPGAYPVRRDNHIGTLDTRRRKTADWLSLRQQAHRQRIESLRDQFELTLLEVSCNRDAHTQLRDHWS